MLAPTRLSHAVAGAVATVLLAAGLTAATTGTAEAVTKVSTKNPLKHLDAKGAHPAGYQRSKFTLWIDADHDGCNTRDGVLITAVSKKPHVGSGCDLTSGRWESKYDGVTTTNSTTFDIDHLVPFNAARQSAAWNRDAATRKAYPNDLGYSSTLIAFTAHRTRRSHPGQRGVVGAGGDLDAVSGQDRADRLAPHRNPSADRRSAWVAMKRTYQGSRGSSSRAKKLEAANKISFARAGAP